MSARNGRVNEQKVFAVVATAQRFRVPPQEGRASINNGSASENVSSSVKNGSPNFEFNIAR